MPQASDNHFHAAATAPIPVLTAHNTSTPPPISEYTIIHVSSHIIYTSHNLRRSNTDTSGTRLPACFT